MTEKSASEGGRIKPLAIFSLSLAAIAVALFLYGGKLRRFVRESLMQRVTSAHYEILCPTGAFTQSAMSEFEARREPLFAALDKKLGGADSNKTIRIVFDPQFPMMPADESGQQPYMVIGTTVRTRLNGQIPEIPAAADAEALLRAAWGEPGNGQLARWAAFWLVGEWRGAEIGMAAAQVEQRLGHQKLASLLSDPGDEISSPDDRALLGAAWISEIAEFGGMDAVKKLYAAKMSRPNLAAVTKALGTTPLELDRKWQLWMYAYLAGMPSLPADSSMPMNMQTGGSH